MKRASIVLLLVCVTALGCAATGGQFRRSDRIPGGMAALYIYRPSNFLQGGTWPLVTIDGEQQHPLRNGGYLYYVVSPGAHTIRLGKRGVFSIWAQNKIEYPLQVEANRVSYYRLDLELVKVDPFGLATVRITLSNVSKEQAMPQLKEMKLSS